MDSEFPDFLLMNQNWNQQQRQQTIDPRHLLSDITSSSSSSRALSPLEQQNRLSFLEQHQHRQPFPIRNHLQQPQHQNSTINHQRIRLPGDTTISRSNLVGTSFIETSVDSTSPPPIIQSSSSVASSSSSSNGLGSAGSVAPEQEKKIANSIRGRGSFCVVFFY